ncbi:hypothetical protein HPHPA11_0260 [Helicobacter pylori Hp A-11]|uniref:Uncharacterized protein n=1 Tax=Helicobacter pylori Hp A-11 TaxID=992035 RepID=N4TIS1_HELPX|nr:hypothetical protein HPHPA11_0260 [Helicobacter pylori Hp A-11]
MLFNTIFYNSPLFWGLLTKPLAFKNAQQKISVKLLSLALH